MRSSLSKPCTQRQPRQCMTEATSGTEISTWAAIAFLKKRTLNNICSLCHKNSSSKDLRPLCHQRSELEREPKVCFWKA